MKQKTKKKSTLATANRKSAMTTHTQSFNFNNYIRLNQLPIIITAIFAFLLCINIFIPPLGTKTSTDFGRVMDLFNLYYQPGEKNWDSFHGIFNFDRRLYNGETYNGFMGTSSLFILISFLPNMIIRLFATNSSGLYYLVSLGFTYFVAYIIAFYVMMQLFQDRLPKKPQYLILIGILSIWAFNDILFTEYFNSFFQEPGFIVTIFLFIMCFLRYKSFLLDIILFGLVIFSKQQNLAFILMIIPIFIKHPLNIGKCITTLVIIISILYINVSMNTYAVHMNNENGVLSGILHNTSENEAKQILTNIGLDPELYVLRDRDYWGNIGYIRSNPNDFNLQQQFKNAEQITKIDTIRGYFHYPSKLISNFCEYIKINNTDGPFTGNYVTDDNKKLQNNSLSYFSRIVFNKIQIILLINLLTVIGIMIIFVSSKKLLFNKYKIELSLLLLLNINLLLIIPANFIADGYAETVKHCLEFFVAQAVNLFLIIYCGFGLRVK